MIDSYLRSPYQKIIINPILRTPLLKRTVPNALTTLALITGLLTGYFLFSQRIILSIVFLTLSGFLDTLDGSLARHLHKTSDTGAAFDIFSDRVVETAIIIGLFLYAPSRGMQALLMLASSYLCVTSFLVVGIFSGNDSEKSFHYSPGIIERAEAFIFFALMILFPSFFTALSYLYTALVLTTAAIRMLQFYKQKHLTTL
ncbi:MAG: Inner membrane protein YnjF [Chlamydiia bacterium]|nr:Inner membrane protein YnjF [Chlamydiia bacterium]